MIEHGILIGDRIIINTERVLRDSSAWWAHGERGTRPRAGYRISLLCGHWTAGHPRTGPAAGPKVVRAMKAREREDGSPMDVGIHFVIGWDGLIWQTADLVEATTHVGHRQANRQSIGVECCWPGTMTQATKLGMTDARAVRGVARGAAVKACAPSDELLAAWRWLADALTLAAHPLLAIPRQRGVVGERGGVIEHCDVPGGTKVDAAGLLVGALGWGR